MAAQSFPRFPDLPKELRDEIWRQCLPHRVVELNLPDQEYLLWCVQDRNGQSLPDLDHQRGRPCELQSTSRRNCAAPTIARVCHESRKVALKAAGPTLLDHFPSLSIIADSCRSWADFTRDTAHLHWGSGLSELVASGETDLLQKCLESTSKFHTASICADLLDSVHHRNRRIVMDCLVKRPSWSICCAYVWIHATDEAAITKSALWGPLSEERIVLVDARDTKRIAAFRNFWETQGTMKDLDTKAFFEACVDDVPKIHYLETPTEFLEDLQVRWIHDHIPFEEANFDVEELQSQVWLSKPENLDGSEDDPRQTDYGDLPGRPFARQLWSPNRDHPWVQDMLAQMPEIQPTVMFRLCTNNCVSKTCDANEDNGAP